MLYVIYGNNTQVARKKLSELVDSLQKKRPDASLFRLTSENWSAPALNELLQSQGLFLPKYIIVLDQLLSYTETAETVSKNIPALAESEHICILFEEKIKAGDKKALDTYATKIQEYSQEKEIKKEAPRTFALADALATKENKKAWVVFQEIVQDGSVAEEIHGVVWWQFKSILLASQTKSAKESGLSPFVYQKAVKATNVWKKDELEKVTDKLFMMYHKAHRGEINFLVELEKFILSPTM